MASSLSCTPGDPLGLVAHGRDRASFAIARICARMASGVLTGALCQVGGPRDCHCAFLLWFDLAEILLTLNSLLAGPV